MDTIEFKKYEKKGAYHWSDIRRHPLWRNAFVLGRYQNMVTLLQTRFPKNDTPIKILDIGCGDGALSAMLARQGFEVFGIDTSDLAIQLAKKMTSAIGLSIDFRVASTYELPWPAASFDAVLSSDVIEHVAQPERMLHEIHRVLKPDGCAIVSTPIRLNEFPAAEHVVEWFPQEYQAVIREYFPQTQFYQSHPIFWEELCRVSRLAKIIVNLLSLYKNPYCGFESCFKHQALQYSVSKKCL
ncbi:MAG: class I SAM-dependent methyltransferase [Magnetococcales bacterium]|nr:class I SAM-dependent methyltransferase [Magnetococcales bacterium]